MTIKRSTLDAIRRHQIRSEGNTNRKPRRYVNKLAAGAFGCNKYCRNVCRHDVTNRTKRRVRQRQQLTDFSRRRVHLLLSDTHTGRNPTFLSGTYKLIIKLINLVTANLSSV